LYLSGLLEALRAVLPLGLLLLLYLLSLLLLRLFDLLALLSLLLESLFFRGGDDLRFGLGLLLLETFLTTGDLLFIGLLLTLLGGLLLMLRLGEGLLDRFISISFEGLLECPFKGDLSSIIIM